MPILETFKGVKIHVYNGEHRPAHIHGVYNEYEVLLEIESGRVYAGSLPKRQQKIALDWLIENRDWALHVFYELNSELR
jgi:hypothetical protein